jgi:hypothetical protein
MTIEELVEAVRYYATGHRRAGPVFFALLGSNDFRDIFPDGIERLKGAQLAIARSYMPKVELPKIQSGLVARVDKLARDTYQSRLTMNLEKVPPPPREVLVQRVLGHDRLSDSIFAHAEVIALDGVLTTEQAERCLNAVWKQKGTRALLDPALGSRLRLAKSQRDEVLFLLEEKKQASDEQDQAQASIMGLIPSRPELKVLDEQIARNGQESMNQVDAMIWDLLTPSQLKALNRILSHPNQPVRSPAGKAKKSRKPA